jgi:hypothetical protein
MGDNNDTNNNPIKRNVPAVNYNETVMAKNAVKDKKNVDRILKTEKRSVATVTQTSRDDSVINYNSTPDKPKAKVKENVSTPTVIPSPTTTDTSSPTSHKKNHQAIYKIFPSSYPNNRGRYVGKEYIKLLKDPSFMDNFDDVDFYMNALFKNMANDLTDEKTGNKKTPRSILPYFEKVIQFDPTTYTKAMASGGKKSRKHRKTSNHHKKQKRRTYKKKN